MGENKSRKKKMEFQENKVQEDKKIQNANGYAIMGKGMAFNQKLLLTEEMILKGRK